MKVPLIIAKHRILLFFANSFEAANEKPVGISFSLIVEDNCNDYDVANDAESRDDGSRGMCEGVENFNRVLFIC